MWLKHVSVTNLKLLPEFLLLLLKLFLLLRVHFVNFGFDFPRWNTWWENKQKLERNNSCIKTFQFMDLNRLELILNTVFCCEVDLPADGRWDRCILRVDVIIYFLINCLTRLICVNTRKWSVSIGLDSFH